VASGLTLVFGIMGIINLAHGSFYMIGAYLAFVLASATGSLVMAIVLGIPLAWPSAPCWNGRCFRHLYKRDHLEQVLLTYGLILIFEQCAACWWATTCMASPSRPSSSASIQLTEVMSYPVYRLAISAVCIVLAGGAVLPDPAHPPGHDDPRRQRRPRPWSSRWASTST
jgi:branched-chain amino acid transport system permease protein